VTGWEPRPTLKGELYGWWLEVRGPLALDVRRRLLTGVLVAGAAAVVMNRAARKLEEYIP
jgi:hypothetical protein